MVKNSFLIFVAVNAVLHCPADWVEGPVGNCYKFVNSPKVTWNQAHGLRADMGGALARLESWIEIYSIRGYRTTHSNSQKNYYWLGGYRTAGKWVWKGQRENNPITVTDWAPSQPDNAGGVEGCLHLISLNPNPTISYQWNDLNCNSKLPFICERNKIN